MESSPFKWRWQIKVRLSHLPNARLLSHLDTIGHVRNPWPLLLSAFTSFLIRGSGWEQRQRVAFYPLIKGHLGRYFSPDSSALVSFFFLAPHEGVCGRGQTLHLIKDTFHISSPLSPVISLFTRFSYLSPPCISPLFSVFSLSYPPS